MLELCCKPPPRFAEEILAITKEEQEKGYCSQFLTKAELWMSSLVREPGERFLAFF